jgi:hypothetical protein
MTSITTGAEYARFGKPDFASGYMTKARSLAERLAQLDTSNAQAWSEDLAFAYARTAATEIYMRPEAAIQWHRKYRKSIALSRNFCIDLRERSIINFSSRSARNSWPRDWLKLAG